MEFEMWRGGVFSSRIQNMFALSFAHFSAAPLVPTILKYYYKIKRDDYDTRILLSPDSPIIHGHCRYLSSPSIAYHSEELQWRKCKKVKYMQ